MSKVLIEVTETGLMKIKNLRINYKVIMRESTIPFINAIEKNKEHPETFHIPALEEILAVKVGDNVKIANAGSCSERFWVQVTSIDPKNEVIKGTVNNELIFADDHGLRLGDPIEFSFCHVFALYRDREIEST